MDTIEAIAINIKDKIGTIILKDVDSISKVYELLNNNNNFVLEIDGKNGMLMIADSILPAINNGDIVLEAKE